MNAPTAPKPVGYQPGVVGSSGPYGIKAAGPGGDTSQTPGQKFYGNTLPSTIGAAMGLPLGALSTIPGVGGIVDGVRNGMSGTSGGFYGGGQKPPGAVAPDSTDPEAASRPPGY